MDERISTLIADPQSLNFYAYSRSNPTNFVDPSGEFAQYLLAGLAGAAVGVGVQASVDTYNVVRNDANWSSGNTYAAAAAGGAATAVTFTGTLNPFVAGAAGGVTQEATQQYLDTGSVGDLGAVGESAAIGAILGAIPGPDIPGITSGKGSMEAVANQIKTKLANGTIENVSLTTGVKMFTVDAVNSLPGEIASATIQNVGNQTSGVNWRNNILNYQETLE